MKNPLLVPEFEELIATGNKEVLRAFCEDCHPATAGELLSALEPEQIWKVLKLAEPERRADIFSHLDEYEQEELVEIISREDVAALFSHLESDDRANLFRRLPAERQELVMPALAQAEREDIRRLTSYAEGTAGAIMTSEYATLPPNATAGSAIEHLRQVAPNKETIYYSYVLDENRRLLGYISLRDLIVARRDAKVRDLMHESVIFAHTGEDQEEAARKIQKFDLIALPVVNDDNAMVGIITHDDAIDVMTQEHIEDLEKLMAIGGSHEAGSYMRTSPWGHFRNRAGWVAVLAVVGMLSGLIMQRYEDLLDQFKILIAFVPMLADTGGNTGSQSATLVIRALALKEIEVRDTWRILWKEAQVSVMLGAVLAILAFGRVMLYKRNDAAGHKLGEVGLAIAIALGLQVVASTLIGALLPMIAARSKLDPALIASPALTTIVDITGLLIYFATVKMLLGI